MSLDVLHEPARQTPVLGSYDVVVLGGGLSNQDLPYTAGVEAIAKRLFGREMRTQVVRHQLGDSAGVIGAALLAR